MKLPLGEKRMFWAFDIFVFFWKFFRKLKYFLGKQRKAFKTIQNKILLQVASKKVVLKLPSEKNWMLLALGKSTFCFLQICEWRSREYSWWENKVRISEQFKPKVYHREHFRKLLRSYLEIINEYSKWLEMSYLVLDKRLIELICWSKRF